MCVERASSRDSVGYQADVSSVRSKPRRLDTRRRRLKARLKARSTLAYNDVVYRTSSWTGATMRNRKTYRLSILAVLGLLVTLTLAHAQSRPAMTREIFDQWMTELSNWGRWGKEDELGAVNLITAAKRKQAAALVREGA